MSTDKHIVWKGVVNITHYRVVYSHTFDDGTDNFVYEKQLDNDAFGRECWVRCNASDTSELEGKFIRHLIQQWLHGLRTGQPCVEH